MIDLLIKNCKYLMTMNPKRDLLGNASIAVDKGRIVEIGDAKKVRRQVSGEADHRCRRVLRHPRIRKLAYPSGILLRQEHER